MVLSSDGLRHVMWRTRRVLKKEDLVLEASEATTKKGLVTSLVSHPAGQASNYTSGCGFEAPNYIITSHVY